MHIDDYEFGSIVINGKTYTTDVIVFPDRVRAEWWRRHGHKLLIEDLKCIFHATPEILVVGTGFYNKVQIPTTTHEHLLQRKIGLIAKDTPTACKFYNSCMESKQRVVAALHLTC